MTAVLAPASRPATHDWPVWLLVVLALAVGAALRSAAAHRTVAVEFAGTHLRYPAGWIQSAPADTASTPVFGASALDAGIFGDRIELRQLGLNDVVAKEEAVSRTPVALASAWSLTRGRNLLGYRILGQAPARALGQPAARLDYAYLADPPGGPLPGTLPVLIRATDTLVQTPAGPLVLTVAGPAERTAELERLRNTLVAQWTRP